LGVRYQSITPAAAQAYNLPVEWGVYVTDVVPNSPAANAGVQPGDILTQIGDIALSENQSYLNALFQHQPGDTVTIRLVRGPQTLMVQVTLGESTGN
jgi:serine protease DegQ